MWLAGQSDDDLRNRIRLAGSQVQGRCLEMRAYGYNVPAGGRFVYASDSFHSESLTEH